MIFVCVGAAELGVLAWQFSPGFEAVERLIGAGSVVGSRVMLKCGLLGDASWAVGHALKLQRVGLAYTPSQMRLTLE